LFFGLVLLTLATMFAFVSEFLGVSALSHGSFILAAGAYLLIRHALFP
jgi:hypothetical protein